jgi:hypothetical protein
MWVLGPPPVPLGGEPVMFSGTPVMFSGAPVPLGGEPVTFSGAPVPFGGCSSLAWRAVSLDSDEMMLSTVMPTWVNKWSINCITFSMCWMLERRLTRN